MYLTGVVCYLVAWLILGQDGRDQLSKESSMDFMVISNSLLLLLLFPHLLPSCVSFSSFHFFLSNFLFSWLFSLKVPSAETLSIADDQADMLLIDGFMSKILLETNRYFKQNPKSHGITICTYMWNLFMGYYENQWLNDFKDLRFCFILDMWMILLERTGMTFLCYLNARHLNIRFSFETQSNRKCPISDVFAGN